MKTLRWLLMLVVLCPFASAAEPVSVPASAPWTHVDEGQTGLRQGAALVAVPPLRQMLLVGLAQGAPFVQAFDPQTRRWSEYASAQPVPSDFNNYNKQPVYSYQAAYDPGTKTVFCLSMGSVLYAFDTEAKTWKASPPAVELENLAWPTLACDPQGKRLVVVGAEKKGNQLGWSRTVVYDIAAGTWQRLEVSDPQVAAEHQRLVAATEALIDLGGRIRLAWYRDPQGTGSEADRARLIAQCGEAKAMPGVARSEKLAAELDRAAEQLARSETLVALKTVRACQRQVEELALAQYPIPCSRRNSPLVFDPAHNVFVLFGGDRQDHLMNDTWVLDLSKRLWRRVEPKLAPSPRAGHALVHLPKSGKIALYEGYVQASSTDYGSVPYALIAPVQLWLYDVPANRWDLAGVWPAPPTSSDKKETPESAGSIAPVGYFYGGEGNNRYSAPALAADADDRLVLAGTDTQKLYWCRWKRPATTWMLEVDAARGAASNEGLSTAAAKLGAPPNTRLVRPELFRADFCEVEAAPPDSNLDALPANQWVKLPAPPRNPARGCRGRDWSTSVWDSDRDQILLWGGGHCVRSASTVLHYSPVASRIVEGFDADESYGSNSPADGTLALDTSLLGRPWISVHNYKHYAYDPRCQLLVAARGYLYDPARMDWLRLEKQELPYQFKWGATVTATSRHGAIVWAQKLRGEQAGLWQFDRQRGWQDLEPKGNLFVPWCDTHGMVYDSKRDRLLMSGIGGGYNKTTDGTLLAFDFADKTLKPVVPENIDLGKTGGCLRELAYAEHADWMLLGLHLRQGDAKNSESKKGKAYTRVYDASRNRYGLLDAGNPPDSHGSGWMYDAKRRLVYAFSTNAEAWALRLDPATARLLDEAPAQD